jgi:hypothetical protein
LAGLVQLVLLSMTRKGNAAAPSAAAAGANGKQERTTSSLDSVGESGKPPSGLTGKSSKSGKSGKGFLSFMRRNSKDKEQEAEGKASFEEEKKQDTASSNNGVSDGSGRPHSTSDLGTTATGVETTTSPSRPISTAVGSQVSDVTGVTPGTANSGGSSSTPGGPISIARSESSYHTLDENGEVKAKQIYTYQGRRGKRAQNLLQSTRTIVGAIDQDTAGLEAGGTIHGGIPLKLRQINKSKFIVPRRPAKDALVDLEAKEEELEDAAVKAILNRQRREIAKWDLAHIAAVAAQDLGDDSVKTQIQRMMTGTPVTTGTVTPGQLAGPHAPHLTSSGRHHHQQQHPPGTGYTNHSQFSGFTGGTFNSQASGSSYHGPGDGSLPLQGSHYQGTYIGEGSTQGSGYAYFPDGGNIGVGESLPAVLPMPSGYGSRGVSPQVSPFGSRRDSPAGSQMGAAAAAAAAGQGMDFTSAQQRLNHALAGFTASAAKQKYEEEQQGRRPGTGASASRGVSGGGLDDGSGLNNPSTGQQQPCRP